MSDHGRPHSHNALQARVTPARSALDREHLRVAVNQEFEDIEDYIAEYVSDVSHGGVFIRSKNPLPIGTRVNLKFSIILEDFEVVEGEGEVVRVESSPFLGMGVAFTRLTAESKQLVDRVIAAQASGQF